MIRIPSCALLLATGLITTAARAQDDPGRAVMGHVKVAVYYGTDGDPKVAGPKFAGPGPETEKRLRAEKRLQFKHYRRLGVDVQPLFRSYENWAQPLRPSDEVLVRFEARGQSTPEATPLDVELWLGRKKVLKTDTRLRGDRQLLVLGPEWRRGRLIIAVGLAPKKKPGP